jgi:hypothetical protein
MLHTLRHTRTWRTNIDALARRFVRRRQSALQICLRHALVGHDHHRRSHVGAAASEGAGLHDCTTAEMRRAANGWCALLERRDRHELVQ